MSKVYKGHPAFGIGQGAGKKDKAEDPKACHGALGVASGSVWRRQVGPVDSSVLRLVQYKCSKVAGK